MDDTDDGSVLVIILQCETRPCDQNIARLKWVFSDPYFTVQICSISPPEEVESTKILSADQAIENHYMQKALAYAAEGPYTTRDGKIMAQRWWTTKPCIIVKDSSVSNILPIPKSSDPSIQMGGMKHRIKMALDRAAEADLFFLCKWNDECSKYTDVEGSELKWSSRPSATQAIMYTPKSRDYVRNALRHLTIPLGDYLNLNISQENLLATVFVPNIIDFDISLATKNADYARLNECAPEDASSTTSNTNAWLVLIVILIVLFGAALIYMTPKP